MKKKTLKAEACFNFVCVAGFEDKELEEYTREIERKLNIIAKGHKLKIYGFIEVIKV